ncbi:MAG: DUF1638 domain-containing protein [Deltaproteobacteria bacterium]|nr:DUF1638 domain-containing protein [Deltaproteobacteria bacterium]
MPVLGILTCEILELEFAHLLRSDSEIRKITVIEDDYSAELIRLLAKEDLPLDRIKKSEDFVRGLPEGLEILIRVLELGLHNRKRLLQEGLAAAGKEMGPRVDAILLGYGLCGNALADPVALLAEAGVPVFIPMDEDHPVDDCVGLIIGGREAYYEEQCRVAGTFFMIPGWTRHWKHIFRKEHGGWSEELARRLFTGSGYERSLLVPNGLLTEAEMRVNIEEFNRMFGFRTETRAGSIELLIQAWDAAKQSLRG